MIDKTLPLPSLLCFPVFPRFPVFLFPRFACLRSFLLRLFIPLRMRFCLSFSLPFTVRAVCVLLSALLSCFFVSLSCSMTNQTKR